MAASQKGQGSVWSFFRWRREKKSARPKELLAAMLAGISDPAFILDEGDRIYLVNTAGKKLLGDSPEDRSLPARLGSADLISRLARWRSREGEEETAPVEIHLNRAPAPDVWLEGSAARLPNLPEVSSGLLLVVLRNISRLRRLETLRQDFVANVSHDLRTPVTILKGYTESLHEDYDTLNDSDKKQFIERIHRNTARLGRLLEDMLQLAVLEQGSLVLNCQPGQLHNLVREAVDILQYRFSSARVSIALRLEADDRRVAVDPQKMLRVLVNLLENALRHASGLTCIQIETTNIPEGGVALSVADDGSGMAPADRERMFERFFRADKSRAGEKSLGLGLSIVKHIIRLHRGSITAAANRPRGLVLRIEFPPQPEPAEKVA